MKKQQAITRERVETTMGYLNKVYEATKLLGKFKGGALNGVQDRRFVLLALAEFKLIDVLGYGVYKWTGGEPNPYMTRKVIDKSLELRKKNDEDYGEFKRRSDGVPKKNFVRDEDLEKMIELYNNGMSCKQVGEELGFGVATVSAKLRGLGLTRSKGSTPWYNKADKNVKQKAVSKPVQVKKEKQEGKVVIKPKYSVTKLLFGLIKIKTELIYEN